MHGGFWSILLLCTSTLLLAQAPALQTATPGAALPGGLQAPDRPALLTSSPVNQVLPADSAFRLQAFPASGSSILLHWSIEPGYYLYRKSLKLVDAAGLSLELQLPQARAITDEYFGAVEVYYDSLEVQATVATPGREVQLQLEYQGCAEALYCYPPQQKQLQLTLP